MGREWAVVVVFEVRATRCCNLVEDRTEDLVEFDGVRRSGA